MNTQKQSFEELRMRATKGPFKPARSHEDNEGPMFELDEGEQKPFTRIYGGEETVFTCHDLATIKDADAEAITRLMNAFVSGDGFKVLLDAEKAISFAMSSVPVSTAAYVNLMNNRAALRALIAQLDGEGK